ncbi:hypothetical protein [Kroppenstedtia eburnea]|nr:hypothetical protein [Kroppenstedtia eburnea]QKI81038.1 hypothetical protein GXN75_02955 [Kroppenstedtia eburnea]
MAGSKLLQEHVGGGAGFLPIPPLLPIIGYNGQDVTGTEGWERWKIC